MRLTFSLEARKDLAAIVSHGERYFGLQTSRNYVAKLRNTLDLIGRNPMLAHERPEFGRPIRIHPVGAHAIVYEMADDVVKVVRILPSQRNWADHI